MNLPEITKSAWEFVVKYKLVFIFLIAVSLFFIQKKMHDNQIESLSEENQIFFQETTRNLTQMRQLYEHSQQQQEEINARQTEELSRLTSDYNARLQTLETRTRTRRTEFVRETNGNPNEMADRLSKRLGWRHSSSEDNK